MKHKANLSELFDKYLNETCTQEELNQLFDEFKLVENESAFKKLIRRQFQDHKENKTIDHLIERIDQRIAGDIQSWSEEKSGDLSKKIPLLPQWKWLVSTAALLALIPIGYLLFNKSGDHGIVPDPKYGYENDVLPADSMAVLRSGNGPIKLDKESFSEGKLPYTQHKGLRTLIVPKGGTYKVKLDDGSIVWLNANSELRYPEKFNNAERKISLLGEAFFEVAKDKDRPFRVIASGKTIEVLGTSFNVNAYKKNVHATLIEGSIKIINEGETSVLKPGQEAILTSNQTLISSVDPLPAIAWKKGEFYFDGAQFDEIMKEVSRWYNIEYVYEETVPDRRYTGSISRQARLSEVFEMLKAVSNAGFEIEGRNIIVKFKNNQTRKK